MFANVFANFGEGVKCEQENSSYEYNLQHHSRQKTGETEVRHLPPEIANHIQSKAKTLADQI